MKPKSLSFLCHLDVCVNFLYVVEQIHKGAQQRRGCLDALEFVISRIRKDHRGMFLARESLGLADTPVRPCGFTCRVRREIEQAQSTALGI